MVVDTDSGARDWARVGIIKGARVSNGHNALVGNCSHVGEGHSVVKGQMGHSDGTAGAGKSVTLKHEADFSNRLGDVDGHSLVAHKAESLEEPMCHD